MTLYNSELCEYLLMKKMKELKKEILELKEKLSDKETLQKRLSDVEIFNKEGENMNKEGESMDKEGESMNKLLYEKNNQEDKNGDLNINNDVLSNNIKSNDDELV